MDPEALEELKEQQAKMGSIQSAFQSGDIKAGYGMFNCGVKIFTYINRLSSIMAAAEEQTPSNSTPTQANRGGSRTRGNKKTKR